MVANKVETDNKNAVTGGDCGDIGGGDEYGSITGRKVITIVPVRWQEEGLRLTSGTKGEKYSKNTRENLLKSGWPMLGPTWMVMILPCGTI